MDTELSEKLGSVFAVASGCIALIGSFYFFNALTKVWNDHCRSSPGNLKLGPFPQTEGMAERYDIILAQGRILKGLRPLGVVLKDAYSTEIGLPQGLLAYRDSQDHTVLVRAEAIRAVIPSDSPSKE